MQINKDQCSSCPHQLLLHHDQYNIKKTQDGITYDQYLLAYQTPLLIYKLAFKVLYRTWLKGMWWLRH